MKFLSGNENLERTVLYEYVEHVCRLIDQKCTTADQAAKALQILSGKSGILMLDNE